MKLLYVRFGEIPANGKSKNYLTGEYAPNGKHSRHYTDEFNHLRKYRTPKHRYVYFTDRKKAKKYISLLKYPILKYPKGENGKYELETRQKTKILNTITGEIFYE